MNSGISVVICCYNSSGKITPTLQHLLKQELSEPVRWEVILVDNGSEDNTAELALQIWNSTNVPIRIVPEPRKGLSNARQTGIRESEYDLVCFVDDDNWVDSRWIENVYRRMKQHPNVALLGGQGQAVFEKDEPEWFEQFKHCYAIGPQAEKEGIMEDRLAFLYGAGMTMRKAVWNQLFEKGFQFLLSDRSGNNLTSGGDMELCYAIRLSGYDLSYDPDLTFKHFMPAGRITVPYLVKLGGSFGRASVITDVYATMLLRQNGFERLKIHNTILSLLRSFYDYLKYIPVYLRLRNIDNEKINTLFRYEYKISCLSEKCRLFWRYPSIIKSVRKAAWHKEL